jgi:hypothetical protein
MRRVTLALIAGGLFLAGRTPAGAQDQDAAKLEATRAALRLLPPTAANVGVPLYPGSKFEEGITLKFWPPDGRAYVFSTQDDVAKVVAFYEKRTGKNAVSQPGGYGIVLEGTLAKPTAALVVMSNGLFPDVAAPTLIIVSRHSNIAPGVRQADRERPAKARGAPNPVGSAQTLAIPRSVALPQEVEGEFTYAFVRTEDIGTVNVPLCRSGQWRSAVKVKLRRRTERDVFVEYEGDGTWTAEGSCHGEMTWEGARRGQTCKWTTDGTLAGSGAFDEVRPILTLDRRDGSFNLAFRVSPKARRSWQGTCPNIKAGSYEDVSYLVGTVFGNSVSRNGSLTLSIAGTRRWEHEDVKGKYESTFSGALHGRNQP